MWCTELVSSIDGDKCRYLYISNYFMKSHVSLLNNNFRSLVFSELPIDANLRDYVELGHITNIQLSGYSISLQFLGTLIPVIKVQEQLVVVI
jgi:hypothetical protein